MSEDNIRHNTRRVNYQKARRAYRRGKLAERLSRLWLRLKGYQILAANKRLRSWEIDIIAEKGGTVVFVEVKFRTDAATEVVTVKQRRRLRLAAAGFLAHYHRPDVGSRFDLLIWNGWRPPLHIKNAWYGDD